MRRARLLELSAVTAVLAVAFSFAGWGRSGAAVRSAYGLYQAAGRAGLLPDTWAGLGRAIFFVPAAAGAALLAHAANRRAWAAWGYATVGTMIVAAGLAVLASPLGTEPPALLAIGLGAISLGAALASLGTGTDHTTTTTTAKGRPR